MSRSLLSAFEVSPEARDEFAIDGRPPARIAVPRTEAECVDVVRACIAAGLAIVPIGGGTAIDTGHPVSTGDWCAVSLRELVGPVVARPDDSLVTCTAGTPLAEIQRSLEPANQRVPLDPPMPRQATAGGIVASNAAGPWRPTGGTPRDVVVALRAVEPDGSIIQTGAKVVKNAAGYDLCRILAGSFGSLAIITEVTFRASPRPAVIAHAAFEAPAFDVAVQAAAETHRQRSGASYLVAANWPRPCLHIGIAGSADGVAARLEAVAPTLERIGMRQSGQLQSYENLRDSGAGTRGEACARVYGRPSDLSALAPKLEALCDRVTCHVASGVVEIAISRPTLDRVLAVERALPSGDPRVWHRLPLAMKAHVDPWGPARPDRVWMARLKAAFDPSGTMSPCRFVGGL